MMEANNEVSLITSLTSTPVSGFFIRTRLFAKALSDLDQTVNLVEFKSSYLNDQKRTKQNEMTHIPINFVSLASSKGAIQSPLGHAAFEFETLKTLKLMKTFRRSNAVIFTSCLQIFPALLSKILGTKLILDINDVNSRVALRTPNSHSRIFRYVIWRPLEAIGCALSDVIIVNKEEEGDFLKRYYFIAPSKIFVLKTCLDEKENPKLTTADSQSSKYLFEGKKVVLYLANMETFMNRESGRYIIEKLSVELMESGKEFEDVVFVLAGIGSDSFKPLTTNVVTTGILDEDEITTIVNRADICLDPAIITGGVKTKIQLYLKKGKIILTQPSGLEGINLYGRKDLAVITAPIHDYTEKLKFILQNLENFKTLAKNNCEIYEKQFSWNIFRDQVNELLKKVTKKD